MVPAGVLRSAAISALIAVVCWAGGCRVAGLPLLPTDREVRTGRETADAAGSAAKTASSTDDRRALHESNLERESSDQEAPDEAASDKTSPAAEPAEKSESETDTSPERRSLPAIEIVEREAGTYEFVSGQKTPHPSRSTERRLLRAAVSALGPRESSGRSSDPIERDAGAPPNESAGRTKRGVRLHRLVVRESSFELHGTSNSRELLDAYLSRLRARESVESAEIAQFPSTGDASDAEFQLSGTHSHD